MAQTGSLTLTQNSTAVTGSGTAFTTALAAGGFIVATVGGTAYTLGIKSIESNTALTLNQAYNGPTSSGVTFDFVPMATLNLITSALAAQVTYALRAANLDRNNWQQIFSTTGNAAVSLPDGTSWTGPAWGSITDSLAGKADKTALGNAASKNTGTTSGTVAAGDDARIVGAIQKSSILSTGNTRVAVPYDNGSILFQSGSQIVTTDSNGDVNIVLPQAYRNLYGMICQSGDTAAFHGAVSINAYNYSGVRIHCTTATGANKANSTIRIMYTALGDIA